MRYAVYPKGSNQIPLNKVFEYIADSPQEWNQFPFSSYDHVENPDSKPAPSGNVWDHLLDTGPFYDRFSSAKIPVLTSTDPVVKAIIQDCNVRKWVDLTRPDLLPALYAIQAQIPSLTDAIIMNIMHQPVSPIENLALRKLYFNGVE